MRTGLAYTTARILLFVASTVLLYLAGARGIILLGLALLVSGLASYVLLSRQRDVMSAALNRRVAKASRAAADFSARLDEGAAAEDVDEPEGSGITQGSDLKENPELKDSDPLEEGADIGQGQPG
jgi:hypothetical protein